MENGVQVEKKLSRIWGRGDTLAPGMIISKLISSLWGSIWGNLKSQQMRGYQLKELLLNFHLSFIIQLKQLFHEVVFGNSPHFQHQGIPSFLHLLYFTHNSKRIHRIKKKIICLSVSSTQTMISWQSEFFSHLSLYLQDLAPCHVLEMKSDVDDSIVNFFRIWKL